MQINRLTLPSYLMELLATGRWKKPEDIGPLAEMTGVQRPEDFSFLSPDAMEQETNGGYFLVEQGLGHIYGLYSSRDPNKLIEHAGYLDVTNSVVIADNWDEEVICLDYQENPDDPCVVLSIYPTTSEETAHWKLLAKNFREFADKLNL